MNAHMRKLPIQGRGRHRRCGPVRATADRSRLLRWCRYVALPAFLSTLALLVMNGCAHEGQVAVREPTTAVPVPRRVAPEGNGAIYQASANYQPLFEDRRARNIGDTITVNINEKQAASRNADSSTQRTGSAAYSVPTFAGIFGANTGVAGANAMLQGQALAASSDNKFQGKGASSADNAFTGTITVTVVDVLPNGNLIVSGEKQIGINRNSETIRLSGVVTPASILNGNLVSSAQIADARIDYKGTGYIDEAQTLGFLARFFLSILPF